MNQKTMLEWINKGNWEIKTLEEISTDIYRGVGVTRDQLGSGDYPAVKCGDINSRLPRKFTKCISYVDLSLIKKPRFFEYGDILIGCLAGKVEQTGKVAIYLGNDKCLAADGVIVVRTNQNPRFIAHTLTTSFCRKQFDERVVKSMACEIFINSIKTVKIPLPPIHIQDEIANYFDEMEEAVYDLKKTTEKIVNSRKGQLEYYKDLIIMKNLGPEKNE